MAGWRSIFSRIPFAIRSTPLSRSAYWAGILLVLLAAAGLRLAEIPHLPFGLHYDEAANNILAREIAFGGYRPVFIGAYTGKEVLFFYLGALWFRLVGTAPWVLRLNGAVIGLLAVAATGAAARPSGGRGRRAVGSRCSPPPEWRSCSPTSSSAATASARSPSP